MHLSSIGAAFLLLLSALVLLSGCAHSAQAPPDQSGIRMHATHMQQHGCRMGPG